MGVKSAIQKSILCLGISLALTACYPKQLAMKESAKRLAGPAFMIDRTLDAGQFTFKLYERIHDRGGIANLYIEGDDELIMDGAEPDRLTSLHSATRDKSENLIYIGRPCQFSAPKQKWTAKATHQKGSCDLKYLRTHRFSNEVISSYSQALDEIKQRWGIRAFNLYGHAGGGSIATLLSAKRSDILSLTTVSSILDKGMYVDTKRKTHKGWNAKYEPSQSLDPANVAILLANLPQYHYIGAFDNAVPPATLLSYITKTGPTNCVYYQMIQENSFSEGWVEKWPAILKDRPICKGKRHHPIHGHGTAQR